MICGVDISAWLAYLTTLDAALTLTSAAKASAVYYEFFVACNEWT